MLSMVHELLLELFRSRPGLAGELLAGPLGVDVPAYAAARWEPGECTQPQPAEFRADAVVVLADAEGPVLAVVIEVQLSRDVGKQGSWPVYVTTVQQRYRCPAELLVVCPDRAVAAWAGRSIPIGVSGSQITPLVLGPERIPVVTDPTCAVRHPELAALSAIAHGDGPGGAAVLEALLTMLAAVDDQRADAYYGLVFEALPEAARTLLEELVNNPTREYSSPTQRRLNAAGRARGRAEGRAEALLTVLDASEVEVPAQARARILACTDTDQLDTWLRRVRAAQTIDDVLG